MDSLTHALTGASMAVMFTRPSEDEANTPFRQRTNTAILVTAVLASTVPDFDYVTSLWGSVASFRFHRGPTHSIVGILILGLVLALILHRFFPQVSRWRLLRWSYLGMTVHVLMDLLNTYSTYALWPFYRRPLSLEWLGITDPFVLLILIGGLVLSRLGKLPRRKLGVFVFFLLIVYVGARGYTHNEIKNQLVQYYHVTSGQVSLNPRVADSGNWTYVVRQGNKYLLGNINVDDKKPILTKTLPIIPENKVTAEADKTEIAWVIDRFTRFRYTNVKKQGDRYVVDYTDLRYGYQSFITGQVVLDKNLNLLSEKMKPF